MTNDDVLFEVRNRTAWITMNKPERRNALSGSMLNALYNHLTTATTDDAIHSIVITGEGPAFCAGADLSDQPRDSMTSDVITFVDVYRKILDSPKPTIAAVNGAAFAGGLGLIGASDIVITRESAQFSFSEVHIGVIPAMISVILVPRLGLHHCRRLFLTGERFDGHRAVELGIAHVCIPDDELTTTVESELSLLTKGGPIALAECKKLLRMFDDPNEELFDVTQSWSARVFSSPEAQEGMAAFRERREPAWRLSEVL